MSTSITCDGCGKPIDGKPVVIGVIIKRDYHAASCAVVAQRFVDTEEALRVSVHEKFIAERELLISKLSEGGFKLPDVE